MCTRGCSVRKKHHSTLACCDGIACGHGSKVLIRRCNRGDQVGATAWRESRQRSPQLCATVRAVGNALRDTITDGCGTIEGFQSKTQLAAVLRGNGIHSVHRCRPVGSPHTARAIHHDQKIGGFASCVRLGGQHTPEKQGQPHRPQDTNASFVFHDRLHDQHFLIDTL